MNLTTTTPTGLPTPQSREVSDLIAHLSTGLTRSSDGKRWEIAESRFSRPDARQALEARSAELSRSMIRAASRQLAQLIAQMFLRFPSAANAPDQDARIAAYVSDLAGFPLWAVQKAVYAANGQFAPSAAQLVQTARQAVQPVCDEQASIARILMADTVGEGGKLDSVDKGFDELRDQLCGEGKRKSRAAMREDAQRALEAMRLKREPLPKMSNELRAIVADQIGATA